ncbi:MAG: UDP-3-O-(3-hydroxymyristoyl)glucosamine N-acyltransferase [Bacteroidota bacterium]|nr:UDP-3-O-(3-hydroxymyristoyl)glucosamine N-acyltransferase [Bacteroidota bacterium]MDP4205189.1 UDP-3-O-(3-hydroxymyristoyl)glucosamine N-acyltransferase [Bacteroidota bacterium]
MEISAQNIAQLINGEVEGDGEVQVSDVSKIEQGRPGTLTFLANPQYTKYIYDTKASVVLVSKDFIPEKELTCTLIRVENPYHALATLLDFYVQSKPKKTGIENPSYISSTAQVGDNAYIGAFAYLGQNVKLGKNVKVYPHVYVGDNVVVDDDTILFAGAKVYEGCKIGKSCIIHAGAVIGADGFGFAPDQEGHYKKIPQVGYVEISDNVEIGANTTIDRGSMGNTIIGEGTKLDNLIQIGHNVEVGKDTVIVSQVGVAGSSKIGNNCMIGGQVGISGHLHIGNRVQVGAQSGIMHDINDGEVLLGSPSMGHRQFFKTMAVFRKLPEIFRELNSLSVEVKKLKGSN